MKETAIKLLKLFTDNGYKAYIVGGYPRDLYLNKKSLDIDICTSAKPKEIKELLGNVILPRKQYGAVSVIINDIRFEITTFREDLKYTLNRFPSKFVYTDELLVDLNRRDFIMNTLCIDDKGEFIDLLGAKDDIDNKIIRMVGDPDIRLKEDALRILRAVRFATILDFTLDEKLALAIKKRASLLKNISYERKKEELDKIFSSHNAAKGIKLILDLNLAKPLELTNLKNIKLTDSLLLIWAQLDVLDIYHFSNIEKKTIKQLKFLLDKNVLDAEILYHNGLYACSLVGQFQGLNRDLIIKAYHELPIHERSEIKVSGKDIAAFLHQKPGPFIQEVLNDLEKAILLNEVANEKEASLNYIKNKY